MKKLLLCLLTISLLTGCKKQYDYPDVTLIGTWYSSEPVLQFPIRNTEGKGNPAFLRYNEGDKDMIKITDVDGVTIYTIKWIGNNELFLVDSLGNQIAFRRIYQ